MTSRKHSMTGVAPHGSCLLSAIFAVLMLLSVVSANPMNFPPQSIETACHADIESFCSHISQSLPSAAQDTVACLRRTAPSKLERECGGWVRAHKACEDTVRSVGHCDLDRSTLRQCLRETHHDLLPAECVDHALYQHAVRSPVMGRKQRS
jgi:hypothetical protein